MRRQIKDSRKTTLYFILLYIVLYFGVVKISPPFAYAQSMSNDNFIIEGSFNTSSGNSSSTNNKLRGTVGETGPGLYVGKNYKVKAGLEYISPVTAPFSFSLSETLIDFGVLSATNPVTRTTTITIRNDAGGYNVIGSEDHPLLANNGGRINDTTCDNGSCSDMTAALWTNTLTYGFGYRCDNIKGTDCDQGFTPDNYKQFADSSKKENPAIIMAGIAPGETRQGKITYKVTISGTQQPGTYTNTITYIAAPGF